MGKLIYFDYCAIAIFIILMVSTVHRGLTKGRAQRVFMNLLVIGFIAAVFDVIAVWFDRMGEGHITLKYISHSAYLLTHNMSTPMYVLYLLIKADVEHRLEGFRKIIFSLPFAGMLLVLLTNPIHHKLFYCGVEDAYTRGPLFGILYLSATFYVLYAIVHLIYCRHIYQKDQYIALFSVIILMIVALIIQFLFPHLLLEMLANALGLLYLSTMVQRSEDYIDTDTGWGKKSAYVEYVNRALHHEKHFQIVMLNLMNYYALHEMLGYSGMKHLLQEITERLEKLNAQYHFNAELYYLGVGKFRLVFEHRNYEKAEDMAKEINFVMQSELQMNGIEVSLVPLVCITRCPEDISNSDSLIAFGDDLMAREYTGEVLYAADIYQKERYDIMQHIDSIIENALSKHRFEVYYQPIYSVEEKCFNSAEALLRLKDEIYGFIPPDVFIPAAEKSGAIHRIGTYVLEEVCKFIASDEFKALQVKYIEINLSVAQCMRPNLADEVMEIMNRYQVTSDQINLEITETAASYSQNAMLDNIDTLVSQGISFSLDDYGTGYSNMRRIASMPFQIVKLDKSFTNEQNNPKVQIILENTVRMIKDMNMKIVVEGIETAELVQQFSELKCEYIQGYFYSKPIPRKEFVAFIKQSLKEG